MKGSTGVDHTISSRPLPSLRRYPKGCPPLRARWFYAVDVPKRKPFVPGKNADEQGKPPALPKKLVPFSHNDSQSIETAFQGLADDESISAESSQAAKSAQNTSTKVPVNEDYLFDVDIERRELEPAYWLGPIYEVRRGSWFYQESPLRPCDENLANQLEEGYLKLRPWENVLSQSQRAASQPRSRPSSMILDRSSGDSTTSTPTTPKQGPVDARLSRIEAPSSNAYRLFGSYMNSTATYQDANTAWLSTDDFMSRMSSTVYQRFGSVGGTKLVRGYSEPGQAEEKPQETTPTSAKRKSAPPGSLDTSSTLDKTKTKLKSQEEKSEQKPPTKRSTLERQLSSLAGAPDESSDDLAEEARQEEEQEMEDYKDDDRDEQGREIDHLILVTHGIGQRLGLRLDSINFIHDVNTLRKSLKTVYENSPDLQALNSQMKDMPKNCRLQVLPVCWRHLLDFPRQSLRQNRKELDLADVDEIDEDEYPSLADITVDGVPAVRNLITDLAMDVLLYQSAYREHIAGIVQRECNRIFKLFKERNPSFSGRVSLIGHSLGSAILFDILCRQKDHPQKGLNITTRKQAPATRARKDTNDSLSLDLDFDCENFFCLGSPIALFQMLKGRTIAGRRNDFSAPPESPFDPDPMDNPFDASGQRQNADGKSTNILPISVSSPKCQELYNIFHPTDPISYRMEPLISPTMASLKPQALPYTKRGLFGAPGIADISARVGQNLGSMWYNFTSGVASSLLNRSLGLTGQEQALAQDNKAISGQSRTTGGSNNATSTAASLATKVPTIQTASSTLTTGPLIADMKKQHQIAAEASHADPSAKSNMQSSSTKNPSHPGISHLPTLIDSDLETLYSGFEKQHQRRRRRLSQSSTTSKPDISTSPSPTDTESTPHSPQDAADDSDTAAPDPSDEAEADLRLRRKLRHEESKLRALNSNGRVDYSIQEGVFDISLLASIASHLSYWGDEDVGHFLMGQVLSRRDSSFSVGAGGGGGGRGRSESATTTTTAAATNQTAQES